MWIPVLVGRHIPTLHGRWGWHGCRRRGNWAPSSGSCVRGGSVFVWNWSIQGGSVVVVRHLAVVEIEPLGEDEHQNVEQYAGQDQGGGQDIQDVSMFGGLAQQATLVVGGPINAGGSFKIILII